MTPKQHQFAREIVLGKSQADAYRTAYNTLRMNDNSIRREASRGLKLEVLFSAQERNHAN